MKNLTSFQKVKFILIVVFFLYQFATVFISFKIVDLDFQIMKKMVKFMPYARTFTVSGMLLLVTIVILYIWEVRRFRAKNNGLEKDVQYLKSRLHELESGLNMEADKGEQQ